MAIHCNIGIINEDDSIDMIYCHNNGTPSYQSYILLDHYNTTEKVKKLIALGDISRLFEHIEPIKPYATHTFNNPQTNTTIAYHRDRHEPWEQTCPSHCKGLYDLPAHLSAYYIYLFDTKTNTWQYGECSFASDNIEFTPFTVPFDDLPNE